MQEEIVVVQVDSEIEHQERAVEKEDQKVEKEEVTQDNILPEKNHTKRYDFF
jgi:hypothetical protein